MFPKLIFLYTCCSSVKSLLDSKCCGVSSLWHWSKRGQERSVVYQDDKFPFIPLVVCDLRADRVVICELLELGLVMCG